MLQLKAALKESRYMNVSFEGKEEKHVPHSLTLTKEKEKGAE